MRTRLTMTVALAWSGICAPPPGAPPAYRSSYLKVELSTVQPAFEWLGVDGLGKGKLNASLVEPPAGPAQTYELRWSGAVAEYRIGGAPAWSIEFSERRLRLRSRWTGKAVSAPLLITFNSKICHATLLGHMNEDGSVRLPGLLHLPDYGTFRIRAAGPPALSLGYDANRGKGGDWVKVSFPQATEAAPRLEYTLEIVTVHPGPTAVEQDPRFDGYRRNFLNIFQLNPRFRVLANHSASDPAPLTYFQYAMVAAHTPPLAEGLRATDLLRETLDRYLGGMNGYGMRGYHHLSAGQEHYPYDSLDTFPSLVMAAGEYVRATSDTPWLAKNYPGIAKWAGRILDFDKDGDGLIEYPASGNANSWPPMVSLRPANWWDTIGFGHKDAYSNALAYRALRDMAEMAERAKQVSRAEVYRGKAEQLRKSYVPAFYNPATGVLAGWKSADGKLHDYYFTFVAGLAISVGLVPEQRANQVMDRLLAKMKEVGYDRFDLGLPGNLIPIRREDYVQPGQRFGGSEKEDGSDGFQIYENGGATACHAYWTIQALYQLGRRADADRILFPLLEGFERGGFQGFGPDGLTKDWKTWDGTPHGYEGLLVDNYLALLAVKTGWAKR